MTKVYLTVFKGITFCVIKENTFIRQPLFIFLRITLICVFKDNTNLSFLRVKHICVWKSMPICVFKSNTYSLFLFQFLIGSILGLPSTDDEEKANLYKQCDEFVFQWIMVNKQQYITGTKVWFVIKQQYLTAVIFLFVLSIWWLLCNLDLFIIRLHYDRIWVKRFKNFFDCLYRIRSNTRLYPYNHPSTSFSFKTMWYH